jgi:light-regulated signal transduction histidine kinase (bacteriophytochrome)
VVGDAVQLRQLFQNLVANATKFVADGTTPDVHVSAERLPDGWCVTVADNGIGVDPARREEVFGMFRRLHSREDYDGTGIGLAICKRIVVRQGGSIWVDANPSGGSWFRFTIPDRFGGSHPATG